MPDFVHAFKAAWIVEYLVPFKVTLLPETVVVVELPDVDDELELLELELLELDELELPSCESTWILYKLILLFDEYKNTWPLPPV